MSPEQKMKLSPLKWLQRALLRNVQIPSVFFFLRKIVKKNNLICCITGVNFLVNCILISPMSIEPFNKYDAYV